MVIQVSNGRALTIPLAVSERTVTQAVQRRGIENAQKPTLSTKLAHEGTCSVMMCLRHSSDCSMMRSPFRASANPIQRNKHCTKANTLTALGGKFIKSGSLRARYPLIHPLQRLLPHLGQVIVTDTGIDDVLEVTRGCFTVQRIDLAYDLAKAPHTFDG